MKKYAFLAISAIAIIALSSCKKEQQNEPSGDGSGSEVAIIVTPKTMELAVGDEKKLNIQITPSGTKLKLVYTSSNSDVASVSEAGIVTGLSSGEANIIVSAEGAKADTCKVVVKDWRDILTWSGFTIWNLDKSTILSNDTAIFTLKSGQQVHCVLIPGEFHAWDNGITFTETAEGGTVSGAGHVIIAEAPIYLITDDINGKGPNYDYLGGSLSFIDDPNYSMNDTAYAYCAGINKIVGTAEQHHTWLTDTTGTAEPAITNALETMVAYIDYDAQDAAHIVGMIGKSIFDGDEFEALYKTNISWFEYGDYGYSGLAPDLEKRDWAEPYAWDEIIEKYYEFLGSDEEEEVRELKVAPKHIQGDVKISKSSMLTNRFYEKK